jgi:hypothetical protein
MEFMVDTTQEDIDGGVCRLPHKCMERVAITRALWRHFHALSENNHVRIDAASIRFNHNGYRWEGMTPKTPKYFLILFDLAFDKYGNKIPEKYAKVVPHRYKVIAQRLRKLVRNSPDRQRQINDARRARIEAGIPDKSYRQMTMKERIVGHT